MPAWNRIDIPERELRDLYINKNLSIFQISKRFGCTTGPVYRSLKEYKIPTRSLSEACTKVPVFRKQLQKWYWKDKMSMFEIADKLKCTHSAIVHKFKKLGIKSRGHLGLTKPIRLSKGNFEYLYYKRRLSLDKIAKIIHCSESGLERRFNNYSMVSRGNKNRACKYKKHDFSGNLIEKAYTTPYIRKAKRGTTEIVCLVNRSFDFLLPNKDEIPKWILNKVTHFFSFLAGYSDAEGCFYLKKPSKYRKIKSSGLEIQTQQKNIIWSLWRNMEKYGINSPKPRVSVRAGQLRSNGVRNNKDMWRINVNQKESLWKLIHFLRRYIKHENKIKMLAKITNNIIDRNTLPHCRPINLAIPALG